MYVTYSTLHTCKVLFVAKEVFVADRLLFIGAHFSCPARSLPDTQLTLYKQKKSKNFYNAAS